MSAQLVVSLAADLEALARRANRLLDREIPGAEGDLAEVAVLEVPAREARAAAPKLGAQQAKALARKLLATVAWARERLIRAERLLASVTPQAQTYGQGYTQTTQGARTVVSGTRTGRRGAELVGLGAGDSWEPSLAKWLGYFGLVVLL